MLACEHSILILAGNPPTSWLVLLKAKGSPDDESPELKKHVIPECLGFDFDTPPTAKLLYLVAGFYKGM